MRRALLVTAVVLVAVTVGSWSGGIGNVLQAWFGVAVLAVLLGAWWLFSIEAYRPGARAEDESGRMLHAGDRVSVPDPFETAAGETISGTGWRVQRIVDPLVRVTDDLGHISAWVDCSALYTKRGKTRLPVDDPRPDREVFSRRRLKGERGRLAANAPLVIVDLRPVEVAIVDREGRKVSVPPGRLRKA